MFKRFLRKRTNKIIVALLALLVFWIFFGFPMSIRNEDFPENIEYDIFIDETKDDHIHIPLDEEIMKDLQKGREKRNKVKRNVVEDPSDPIILWWTEFTKDPGTTRTCGTKKCFFTNNRSYMSHNNMKVFMFYGTDFSPNDLPLPREDFHEWALFHEESPKNNYLLMHEDTLALFNHTSTFRRESDFPLSTQSLPSIEWLEKRDYFKTVSQKNLYQKRDGIAPVVFVQTDCDPPSDRDTYVKLLMEYIPVDSYGRCLHNKELADNIAKPIEGMGHADFYELLSHYKFVLSLENAVCKDYMTEKLWRPLMLGTVPIVFGSPAVRDFLPHNNSALLISDFKSVEHLGLYLQHLNDNDEKYEEMLSWKSEGIKNKFLQATMASRTWNTDDSSSNFWDPSHVNFVEAFECFVCNRVHENLDRKRNGKKIIERWANKEHLGCPKRLRFDNKGKYVKEAGWMDYWKGEWERQKDISKYLRECVRNKLQLCQDFIHVKLKKRDF